MKDTKNWKKATYRDGGFAAHARSEAHVNAMLAWKSFETLEKNKSSMMDQLSQEHRKQIEENRDYIKTLAEVLLLTATQNIAQRGHNETMDSDNKGNFLSILELLANYDTSVKKKLNAARNAKY